VFVQDNPLFPLHIELGTNERIQYRSIIFNVESDQVYVQI